MDECFIFQLATGWVVEPGQSRFRSPPSPGVTTLLANPQDPTPVPAWRYSSAAGFFRRSAAARKHWSIPSRNSPNGVRKAIATYRDSWRMPVTQHGQTSALAVVQLGFCASSWRQVTPWVLERVTSKAADFAAFDRAGNGTNAQKSHAARALWELAHDSNNKVGITQAGGIAPLVAQHGQSAVSAAPLLATPVPPEAGAFGSGWLPTLSRSGRAAQRPEGG